MNRGVAIAAVCPPAAGALATLGPWAYRKAAGGGYGTHDDLWTSATLFAVPLLLAVANLEWPIRGRWAKWVYGVPCGLCVALAAVNLPAKFADYQNQAAGRRAIDDYFATLLLYQILQFLAVGAAGVGGVLWAVLAPRPANPAAAPDPAGGSGGEV